MLLDHDFSVKVLDGPMGNPTNEKGNWTMVYDQNIVIELKERDGAKYTANFRYNIKEGSKSRASSLTTGSFDDFDSVCSETMVGLKLTESKFSQCWYGKQDKKLSNKVAEETDLAAALVLAQTGTKAALSSSDAPDATKKQLSQTHSKGLGNTFGQMNEADRIMLAQTVNAANLSWRADAYLEGAPRLA